MKLLTAVLILGRLAGQTAPEERVDDTDYEKVVAVHVKAIESLEKGWRKEPAESLRSFETILKEIEAQLIPRFPKLVEATIAVRVTRGIDKGEVKARHSFFPYRLGGEIAMVAGAPERAVELLQKSPSSAALLSDAKKAVEAKSKKDPIPPTPPTKVTVDLQPFFERRDFTGALDAIRAKGAALADADRLAGEVRREAAAHQRDAVATLASALPRLDQDGFRKDHVERCLQACAKVPADVQSEQLLWVRRLDRWFDQRDPAEFERLATAGAKFGSDFTVLCDRAEDARLKEIDSLVQSVVQAERAERPKLLDRLGESERALLVLLAARDRADVRQRLEGSKAKLPVDDQVLEEARSRPMAIADIRRLSGELDRLWRSDRRVRLGIPEQKELAMLLGLYRCLSLFLDGKSVSEASQDAMLKEAFKSAGDLPPDVSPKVAAVRARLGN